MSTQQTSAPSLPAAVCDRIPILEQALFQLASGQQKAQVRYGNNWVEFHLGSTRWLQDELNRCRALCTDVSKGGNGPRSGIAVLPAGMAPFRRGCR